MLTKSLINVFDAYMYDAEGRLLMVHENLTNTSIAGNCDETEIKNGKGNTLYSSISSNKTLEVTLESNVFDFNLLCLQCGIDPIKEVGDFYTDAKVYTIVGNKITLDKEPKSVADVQIVKISSDEVLASSSYTVTGKEVTFTSVTGDVKVVPYLYTETEAIETVTIEADSFSSAGKLVLKGLEVDANQKPSNYVDIIIERAKPSSSFTIDAQAELTGNSATITFKALKDSYGNLGRIVRKAVK